jgi:hypothetical protein
MHLGLKNGPFVPHKLISTQESPVQLLEFQMDPRQNLNGLRVQETNPDILSFLSKDPANEPPSRFPNRAPLEREAVYRAFCVSLKNLIFRVPSKGALPQAPFMEFLAER